MGVDGKKKVLVLASVASMIDQFNMPNIKLLLKMGYEVHVACNFKEGNTCSRQRLRKLQDELQRMHAVWHQWDCPRSAWAIGKCWTAYRQLQHLINRVHFSWMHCHSPVGGALARIAAHRKGIRVIYTAHGFHFYDGAPLKNWLLYYPVEKMLAYWTDVLLTVNKEDYCFAKQKLKAGKVGYLPGVGVDVRRFQMQAGVKEDEKKVFLAKYQIPDHAAILLSVGELSRRKNHLMVISVLPKLRQKEVHYLICGQGAFKQRLLRKAKKAGVADRVHILGYQEDVAKFYRNADLFVFPSKQEGLPVALIEAMAAGLPCVASDIRGNRELLGQCISKGFPLRQPRKLKEALELFLDHPRLCCESRYNKTEIWAYDLQAVQRRMEKIYGWIGQKAGE